MQQKTKSNPETIRAVEILCNADPGVPIALTDRVVNLLKGQMPADSCRAIRHGKRGLVRPVNGRVRL